MKKLDTALLSDKITARVQADLEAGNLSGASLQVRQCGETVFRCHFGTVSPGGDVPVTDGTLFRLASMTKPITAVAVMTLFDRGLLDIFDPIAKYLPQFADRYLAEADGDEIDAASEDDADIDIAPDDETDGEVEIVDEADDEEIVEF